MFTLLSFWKFSRPHTIIGTSLSVWALYFIVLATVSAPLGSGLNAVFAAWFACLCGNIYIVGLNQLFDVEIDQLNKPSLPLASGDYSRRQGQVIVGLAAILALATAFYGGPWLMATVGISLIIGTAYSMPPIRLKRFSFLAALCILTVRGVVVNLGLFLFFSESLGGEPVISALVWVLTGFILLFTVAIAIFKDVPDMDGDRQFRIQTLTLQYGKDWVLGLTRLILLICYGLMIALGLWGRLAVNIPFFVTYHGVLLLLFWWRSESVDLTDKEAIRDFYQFIWKLFFLEYILFPLACLLPSGLLTLV